MKATVAALATNTKPEFVKAVREKEKLGQICALESSVSNRNQKKKLSCDFVGEDQDLFSFSGFQVLFLAYDGKDLGEHLVAALKKNCTLKGLDTIRRILGGLKFTE